MDSPARLRTTRMALFPVALLALCAVPLAFGPYLAIAGGVALFYGPQLLALEKSLLR